MIRSAFLFSLLVSASVQTHGASQFMNAVLTEVRPDSWLGGVVVLKLAGELSGSTNCDRPDGANNYMLIAETNPTSKELFSVALAAQLSRRSVQVVGAGTCSSSSPSYELVRMIRILDE